MTRYAATAHAPATFVIIEDDEVCVRGINRALAKMRLVNPVVVARDGREGLEVLRGEGGRTPPDRPFIILLDIKMPRMDGHEFLAEVRDDPLLQTSLIYVLTTSDAPEDVERAYRKNVAGYVLKEDPYDSLFTALELVEHVSKVVVLPH